MGLGNFCGKKLWYNKFMLLTVVIPIFNAEKYLERCLKSVFTAVAFAPKVETEVLLIDNGSKDSSLGLARRFATEAPLKIHV